MLASDTDALPKYPWSHNGFFSAFDSASIRRGFEVYRQVRNANETAHAEPALQHRHPYFADRMADRIAHCIGELTLRRHALSDDLPGIPADAGAPF